MKNRVWWFLGFYFLLSLFIIYQLVYLIIIWTNHSLFDLYFHGFTWNSSSPDASRFNPSSYFAIFDLPLIGVFVSVFALTSAIITQTITVKSVTPERKSIFLIISFIVFLIGFYISFTGQLFYSEWDDSSVVIVPNSGGTLPADSYYLNWIPLTELWVIFGFFFGLFISAIIIIVKLYFLNVQWTRYIQRYDDEEMQPELTLPLAHGTEFSPSDTQTITINLDRTFDPKKKKKIRE